MSPLIVACNLFNSSIVNFGFGFSKSKSTLSSIDEYPWTKSFSPPYLLSVCKPENSTIAGVLYATHGNAQWSLEVITKRARAYLFKRFS